MSQQNGSLYLVATPIGNLADITYRAVEILQSADLIAAEDTRHSKRLLQHFSIHTPLISLHEHNEQSRISLLLDKLKNGQQIALISDAGTPLISDPGYRLVKALREQQINVVPIPGACAAINALIASGLPTDRFVFEGFLSSKHQARLAQLQALKSETRTIILYESVHRILVSLRAIIEVFGGQHEIVVARELTKQFESFQVGCAQQVLNWFEQNSDKVKGEFVILIQGASESADENSTQYHQMLSILLAELPLKQAVALAVKLTGASRKLLYSMALTIKNE